MSSANRKHREAIFVIIVMSVIQELLQDGPPSSLEIQQQREYAFAVPQHTGALRPSIDDEDEWEEFIKKTRPIGELHKVGKKYVWHFGKDETDEGSVRECVILEVPLKKDVETKEISAKLNVSGIDLRVAGEVVIQDTFESSGWIDVGACYWEIETKQLGKSRRKVLRWLLFLLKSCPKYITTYLFKSEKSVDNGRFLEDDDSDEDTVDQRIRKLAALKEPEPRRDNDIWFSDEESDGPESYNKTCDGCGGHAVTTMKRGEDEEWKKFCNECPYVSPARMDPVPPGLRAQLNIDARRAKKKAAKEKRILAEKKYALMDAESEPDEEHIPEAEDEKVKAEKTKLNEGTDPYKGYGLSFQPGLVCENW